MNEVTFHLVASLGYAPAAQARNGAASEDVVTQLVLQDSSGRRYLLNPSVGGLPIERSPEAIEALFTSPRARSVRRYARSAERTRAEIAAFFGDTSRATPDDVAM